MATMAEAPDENTIAPTSPPPSHSDYSTPLSQSRIPPDATPWIDYAVEQARVAQKTVEETLDFAISTTRSRLDRFLSTGSAHLHTTVVSFATIRSVINSFDSCQNLGLIYLIYLRYRAFYDLDKEKWLCIWIVCSHIYFQSLLCVWLDELKS